MQELVGQLYPASSADRLLRAIEKIGERARRIAQRVNDGKRDISLFDRADTIVITYGNQFYGSSPPLEYLRRFLIEEIPNAVSGMHILPFCPSSSDEGFSVIDYREVEPTWGRWRHIRDIAAHYMLMVDLVLNHCSAHSAWADHFRHDRHPYTDYFIRVDPAADMSMVFRPRTSPLYHPVDTAHGTEHVWTTFSSDQLDLNYRSPDLFAEMIDIFFYYIEQGATIIRLDAIAYLWKEIGTPSIHHPLTHVAVQLFRALIDRYTPHVLLLTETNVAHSDNISYFGNGSNEAHMVYNFALPPLTLDALIQGDAAILTQWAASLSPPAGCALFNFLASHDGIGLLAAADYLPPERIQQLIDTARMRGGEIGYKETADGPVPYELNINYLSALVDPQDSIDWQARAFLCSQAIMLSLAGVAAPYIHSLLGSCNWRDGIERGEERRSINRQRFDYESLISDVHTTGSLRQRVFYGYKRMLIARRATPALRPTARQQVMDVDRRLFVVKRRVTGQAVWCLHNVSRQTARNIRMKLSGWCKDIISGEHIDVTGNDIILAPYQFRWLLPVRDRDA